MDPAFKTAGQKPGLEIWRIEKMQVVAVPEKDYGKFYSGDSYIVLASNGNIRPTSWDIHFWLGKETSLDEETVAAYKSVELDDLLGGMPVQHREIQNNESRLFMSYFIKFGGVLYLEGGVESALVKVADEKHEIKLYHVKGKREARVTPVKPIVQSLDLGDVFVLDALETIYVWTGPTSSRVELRKGIQFALQLRDNEHSGRSFVEILDTDWDKHSEFFSLLKGQPSDVQYLRDVGGDATHEIQQAQDTKLYRVSDRSGSVEMDEISNRPLTPALLDSTDCFILDVGLTGGIFAWVGRHCSKDERRNVWPLARKYLKLTNKPDSTPMARVNEGAEPQQFRDVMNFSVDRVMAHQTNVMRTDKVAHVQQRDIDVNCLHSNVQSIGKEFMPDDGQGNVQVKRVENRFLRPIDKSEYGVFYSGDSYVIVYSYRGRSGREEGIVYYWHGNHSTLDETTASAIFAVGEDEKFFSGNAVQVRVLQNKEPAHFLKVFGGQIIIKRGGVASGFRMASPKENISTDSEIELYQIRNQNNTKLVRIVQMLPVAASLNSNDVFVLKTARQVFIWHGKGANEYEKTMSREFAKQVTQLRKPVMFNEGDENEDFWHALGGRTDYATDKLLSTPVVDRPARLFQCSNARGYFYMEEIVNFTQEDLVDDDVMLLDTGGNSIFIWIGNGANEFEKRESMRTAKRYLAADAIRSSEDTVILVVNQGHEPTSFCGYFGTWDVEYAEGGQLPRLKAKINSDNVKRQNKNRAPSLPMTADVDSALAKYSQIYPVEILRLRNVEAGLPAEVDAANKENHLSDADFQGLFRMSKEEYAKLPNWKKLDMKKMVGLF